MGTADTIKAFTVEDLRAFYSATFRPDNATLLDRRRRDAGQGVAAGRDEFRRRGRRRRRGRAACRCPRRPARTRREIYLVDKPDAPQSQIRIGSIGVPRSTPDYFPIQVMNTILGGSFSSRLNMNLREKHGYTYGASSVFDMRIQPGPFFAAAGVQTDKTSESLTEFFKELNGILQPFRPTSSRARRTTWRCGFRAGFETTGDISRRLEDVLTYRLPDDYFSRYVPSIEAVTAADVQRVARTYIQPDKLAVVVVGDRKIIEPGIRAEPRTDHRPDDRRDFGPAQQYRRRKSRRAD